MGPDPGVSLNLRVTRFIKSYLRALPWRDHLYYLQGQAYWIMDNARLLNLTGREEHRDNAIRCADVVVSRQTDDGYWAYPQAEWKGRIATVEGCFGALSVLTAFELAADGRYLAAAKRWYEFMVREVGFQSLDGESTAVNYFANVGRGMVPNNSTLALWVAAALAKAAGDEHYLEHCSGMVSFLARCQLGSGELPYVVESDRGSGRVHYLCFQYNAYQFLDLAEYHRLASDPRIVPVLEGLARFLSEGFTAAGDARNDCDRGRPVMHYFTSAVAAALRVASDMGLGDYSDTAARGYERLLAVQRSDGGFDYSWGDYGLLSDRRSYPRNQAMILRHLLMGSGADSRSTNDGTNSLQPT